MFTNGGMDGDVGGAGLHLPKFLRYGLTEANVTEKTQMLAVVKVCHAAKMFLRVAMVILLLWAIAYVVLNSVELATGVKSIVRWDFTNSKFTQKEGLMYLGASTNVARDLVGTDNQLTPLEKKFQDESANKQTFVSASAKRELTPEEKVALQQAGK